MAIWTLTQERAQKLLNDVAAHEQEIDILTRKSPKDLWSADLDEFIAQWRHQLEEDERLAQARPKVKGAKGLKAKSKKKKGEDDSEDDYDAALAAKRKKAPPKKQATLPFMPAPKVEKKPARAATKKPVIVDDDSDDKDAFDDDDLGKVELMAPKKAIPTTAKLKPKVEEPPKQREIAGLDDDELEMIGQSAAPPTTTTTNDDNGDGFMTADEITMPQKSAAEADSDDDSDFDEPVKEKVPVPAAKKTAAAGGGRQLTKKTVSKPAPKRSKPAVDADASIFDLDEEEPILKSRSKRAAAKKPIVKDDSDDDSLDDVGLLVKGVGDESAVSSRVLFASGSSKAASAAAKRLASKPAPKVFDFAGSDSEATSRPSPAKPAAKKSKVLYLDSSSDDEEEPPAKSTAATKKAPAKKAVPAKKSAPAKKMAPTKPAKGRGKKAQDSDDEMDIDEAVDQLLTDSEMQDSLPAPKALAKPKAVPKAASKKSKPEPAAAESSPPARARPGRGRAAAAKPVVYKIDDSSDDDDEDDDEDEDEDEEGSYGDEDD